MALRPQQHSAPISRRDPVTSGRPDCRNRISELGAVVSSASSAAGRSARLACRCRDHRPSTSTVRIESLVIAALPSNEKAFVSAMPSAPSTPRSAPGSLPTPGRASWLPRPIHLRLLLAEAEALAGGGPVLSATVPIAGGSGAATPRARFDAKALRDHGCSSRHCLPRTTDGEEWRCLDRIALRQNGSATWAGGPAIAIESPLADLIELRDPRHFRPLGRIHDIVNIGGKRSSLAHLTPGSTPSKEYMTVPSSIADETGPRGARMVRFVVAPADRGSHPGRAARHIAIPPSCRGPLHLVDRCRATPSAADPGRCGANCSPRLQGLMAGHASGWWRWTSGGADIFPAIRSSGSSPLREIVAAIAASIPA